jgi:cytoskeletal protein CcmA (bactofilin family)
VGDDVRAAGGDVNIESTVGGELYAAGGNVTLTKSAQVQSGAALAGGLVTIDGRIVGKLKASAQRIVLNGEVTGDARMIAEQIELGPTARIGGALNHASRELKRSEGAVVAGATTRDTSADEMHERGARRHWERQWSHTGPSWVGAVLGYLGLLAAGAVFVLLLPKFSAEAPEALRSAPWLSLAIGFGMLVGVPVLAVLLCITLVGIPLGIAAFALYPLLLLTGYLAGALFIAQRARLRWRKEGATPTLGDTMAFLALALLILMLIAYLPFVGPLIVFITTIGGIGACVLEWHRRRQKPAALPG